MRILGVDPGTRITGYGVLRAGPALAADDWGVISFKSGTPIEQRLHQLYSRLVDVIRHYRPQELAVEDPFMGRGHNRYTAPAFAVGQAQAAVLIAAAGQGIPVYRYSPAEVKLAVADYGRASKEQVQLLVAHQLDVGSAPIQPDAADALAVALCHLRRRDAEGLVAREVQIGR